MPQSAVTQSAALPADSSDLNRLISHESVSSRGPVTDAVDSLEDNSSSSSDEDSAEDNPLRHKNSSRSDPYLTLSMLKSVLKEMGIGQLPREVPESLGENEPTLDISPPTDDQLQELESDRIPSATVTCTGPSRDRESHSPGRIVQLSSPRGSMDLDIEEEPVDIPVYQRRKAAVEQAIEILQLKRPVPPAPEPTGLDGPAASRQQSQPQGRFCWSQATLDLLSHMNRWLDGSKAPSNRRDQAPRPWKRGELFSPNLPAPHDAVSRFGYRPADPESVATTCAEAERGSAQPFTDRRGNTFDLEGPVTVPPKALRDCEATARLLCGAANSAAAFRGVLTKGATQIPEELRPALDQLERDLMAVVQYGWRNVGNWLLLRREGALQNISARTTAKPEDLQELYRTSLLGPSLFGPMDQDGQGNALTRVHARIKERTQSAGFSQLFNQQSGRRGNFPQRGSKRPSNTPMAPPQAAKVPRVARQVQGSKVTFHNEYSSPVNRVAPPPDNFSWDKPKREKQRRKRPFRKPNKGGPFKGPKDGKSQ